MSDISVFIVEDEGLIAEDIAEKLNDMGYRVLGSAASSERAIDFLSSHRPDIVLCDIRIKGEKDGIEVAAMFLEEEIPFIFLTSLADRSTLDRAKKTLPYGYIVKPFTAQDIQSAIEMAFYKHQQKLDSLAITKEKIDAIAMDELSHREFEILVDIASGLNNKEIVEKRFISLNTVKFHVRNIFVKLEVSNRAGALHKIIKLLSR